MVVQLVERLYFAAKIHVTHSNTKGLVSLVYIYIWRKSDQESGRELFVDLGNEKIMKTNLILAVESLEEPLQRLHRYFCDSFSCLFYFKWMRVGPYP